MSEPYGARPAPRPKDFAIRGSARLPRNPSIQRAAGRRRHARRVHQEWQRQPHGLIQQWRCQGCQ